MGYRPWGHKESGDSGHHRSISKILLQFVNDFFKVGKIISRKKKGLEKKERKQVVFM